MGVAKNGMVGKKNNPVGRKSTSQINGSKDQKVAQVLLVLDGHKSDGKRKRILDTLKRWKRCKKKIGAISSCKTKQHEGNFVFLVIKAAAKVDQILITNTF